MTSSIWRVALSERGGIVGRGVLVDFVRYAEKRGINYDPLGPYAISLAQIKEILIEEKVEIRQGDILILRCGLSKYLRSYTPNDPGPFDAYVHVGVDPTPELLEWLWDSNIGAVGGDVTAFEALPASDGSSKFCLSPSSHHCYACGWTKH